MLAVLSDDPTLPRPAANVTTPVSEEQACLVAHNILNSLGSGSPAPASSPPAYAPATDHCSTVNMANLNASLANTAPLPPEVLAAAAFVSQLRAGSRTLLVMSDTDCQTVPAEDLVQASVKPAYAASMVDTSALSHKELEDIVVNMRR